MLTFLRFLLLPAGFLYATGAWLRRQYFQQGGRRKKGSLYSIAIGNLAAGGSGKTPMAMFLARHAENKTAVLSRGYKRKTRGFREVQVHDNIQYSGDEPLEMKNAAPELPVFVCENRLQGIFRIHQEYPEIKTVILDDAFQHLPLLADKYVLLTDYQKPFWRDIPMPAGRLREFPCTAAVADAIVVTKCPVEMQVQTAAKIIHKLAKYKKPVFFCHYENAVPISNEGLQLSLNTDVIVVSGLADNKVFQDWAGKHYKVVASFGYPDHHSFSNKDFEDWIMESDKQGKAVILTTRKDFARMQAFPEGYNKRLFFTFTTPKFLFQGEDAFLRILFNHF